MPTCKPPQEASERYTRQTRCRAAPLVVVGALHVDELAWPIGSLLARASNPVRRERRAGGVGANVARAAARCGGRHVVLVAALGDDTDGAWLGARLATDGVEVRTHVVSGRPSGRYTAVHDERGELFVGLADTAIAETLEATSVRERLADLTPSALVLDANLDPRCLAGLVDGEADGADEQAPRVALAVSPAKARALLPWLPSIELLFCNRLEAAALGNVDADAPLETLADALLTSGCRRFVLSDGAEAVLVQTPTGRERIRVPPLEVIGSVNGAGDALAGATLSHWLDAGDLVAAVREAGLPAAAAVVTRLHSPVHSPEDTP